MKAYLIIIAVLVGGTLSLGQSYALVRSGYDIQDKIKPITADAQVLLDYGIDVWISGPAPGYDDGYTVVNVCALSVVDYSKRWLELLTVDQDGQIVFVHQEPEFRVGKTNRFLMSDEHQVILLFVPESNGSDTSSHYKLTVSKRTAEKRNSRCQ